MNVRFFSAIAVVVLTVCFLVYSAVQNTAKAVVTVHELQGGGVRSNIRLGARVADRPIEQIPAPGRGVKFFVRDITGDLDRIIPVEYRQTMPETLKIGRDVILEGTFDGAAFEAKSLVTQCPSKYVPPVPGAADSGGAASGATDSATKAGEPVARY